MAATSTTLPPAMPLQQAIDGAVIDFVSDFAFRDGFAGAFGTGSGTRGTCVFRRSYGVSGVLRAFARVFLPMAARMQSWGQKCGKTCL